ncbi:MAG: SDR family oxidoreductase [Myxococcota bacterium]
MARLDGKVAIITGAARGIGRATAERFAQEGARMMLIDRDEAPLRALARELGAERARAHVADVSDPEQSVRYVAATVSTWGGLDILVANAGIGGPIMPLIQIPVAEFDRIISVNLRGVWLSLRAAIPVMRAGGGGSIVITASYLGLRGVQGGGAYVASKHAVTGLMKSAALEHARDNIRVNTVHPGIVETRMAKTMEAGFSRDDPEEGRRRLLRGVPMRRYGQAQEIANLITFVASDEASYCTGHCFSADGGQTAR